MVGQKLRDEAVDYKDELKAEAKWATRKPLTPRDKAALDRADASTNALALGGTIAGTAAGAVRHATRHKGGKHTKPSALRQAVHNAATEASRVSRPMRSPRGARSAAIASMAAGAAKQVPKVARVAAHPYTVAGMTAATLGPIAVRETNRAKEAGERAERLKKSIEEARRKPGEQDERTFGQKVGFATNFAGAVAGPAAIYSATRSAKEGRGGIPRDIARAATGGKHARSGPVKRAVRTAVRRLDKPLTPTQRKIAAAAGASMVGLQVANWAGDTIAANELRNKPDKELASKMDDTVVKYALVPKNVAPAGRAAARAVKPKGKMPKPPKPPKERKPTRLSQYIENTIEDVSRSPKVERAAVRVADSMGSATADRLARVSARPVLRTGLVAGAGVGTGVAGGIVAGEGAKRVIYRDKKETASKAYRSYDPEAQRNQRLGMYQGAGAAGVAASLAGLAGTKGVRIVDEAGATVKHKRRIPRLPKEARALRVDNPRRTAALAAGALISAGVLGAASSQSRSPRNQSWT